MLTLTPEQVQILTDLAANGGTMTVPTDVLHHDLMLLMNNKLVATDAVEVGKMVLHITDAGRAALAACEVEGGQKLSTPTDNAG